jgi:hypothetical protein
MYRDRIKYLEFRRMKWASGVIALSWLMHIKLSRVRKQLKQSRLDLLEGHRRKMKVIESSSSGNFFLAFIFNFSVSRQKLGAHQSFPSRHHPHPFIWTCTQPAPPDERLQHLSKPANGTPL